MNTKRNTASIAAGSLLIVFGLLVLLTQLIRGLEIWTHAWPLAIVGAGALLFVAMALGGRAAAALAIPASATIAVGSVLLVQNATGYWESWSYAWAIVMIAVGFGNFIKAAYIEDQSLRQASLRTMELGAVLFVLLGSFFEGLIFTGHHLRWLGQWI